jgi:hypothetical protein
MAHTICFCLCCLPYLFNGESFSHLLSVSWRLLVIAEPFFCVDVLLLLRSSIFLTVYFWFSILQNLGCVPTVPVILNCEFCNSGLGCGLQFPRLYVARFHCQQCLVASLSIAHFLGYKIFISSTCSCKPITCTA